MTNSITHGKNAGFAGARSLLPFLYITFVLVCFYPYEFYSAYPIFSGISDLFLHLLFLIVTILLFVSSRNRPNLHPMVLVVVACHCFWMILNSAYKGLPIGFSVFVMPCLALALVYYASSSCGMVYYYRKYNRWILLMTALGAFCFVCIRAGILHPIAPFVDLSDEDTMLNYGITFTQEGKYYCGFFDEPGAIAQWSVFALVFNKLFVKDDRLEILLIVTTLFSFSMGYYIQLFFYLIFFYIIGKRKKMINILLLFVMIGGAVYFAANDSELYEKSIGRFSAAFEDSKTQGLAVDDREINTLEAKSEFVRNPLFGTSKENPEVGNNIYEPLALYGIVGTLFLYLPFLILLVRGIIRKDYELLKCMIVIFIGFTHRPFHKNLLSYFIVYSLVAMCFSREYLGGMQNKTVSRL